MRRLQKKNNIMPLPQGEGQEHRDHNMWADWRDRPLDCFAFHCLASDPNRRFQTIAQCEEFSASCSRADALAHLSTPETVPLADGVEISRYPVTNFQFERFCRDQLLGKPTAGLSWRYTTPFAPVVCVSFLDASSYCDWLTAKSDGKESWRLPTEAEWLLAGGSDGGARAARAFPWGNQDQQPTHARANCAGRFGGPTAVGSHPDGRSPTGCLDLAGNVWEWCVDRKPAAPMRIVKGGSYASPPSMLWMRAADHRLFGGRYRDVGFRVICERR